MKSSFMNVVEEVKEAEKKADIIEEDAKIEAERVIKEGKEQASGIIFDAEKEAINIRNNIIRRGEKTINNEVNNIIDKAEKESQKIRKLKLTPKQREKVFKEFVSSV